MTSDQVGKICKDLEDSKDKVQYIQSTIEFINKKIGYTASVNVDFGGMYKRSSKKFWLTQEELLIVLNNRLNSANEKLIAAQEKFNDLSL